MEKVEVVVENSSGLHARPANMFIKEALKYESDIEVIKDGKPYKAKSIISVLSMGITKGTPITILAEGPDEKEAVDSLVKLIESRFGEE